LTVEENIQLFGGLYGLSGARFDDRRDWVLEMSGLRDQRRQLTGELPLGWKQRLALGCAVLHEPAILFLDEPTSGVDPVARRAFWDLIYRFTEAGTTVFVSTHYLEEAEYCHRVALMNRGRVIALDRPRKLREHLTTPVLEFTVDDAPGAVPVLRAHPLVIDTGLYGRTIHALVRDAAAAARDLPHVLTQAGIAVRGVREIAPSLEDVFVALVQAEGGAVVG
jgi:ABC-2 type transport system ATP-binding protein